MPRLAKPVHVETILAARTETILPYPWAQITQACAIAQLLDRGKLVLVQAPWDA
jgi:hypothetical protein